MGMGHTVHKQLHSSHISVSTHTVISVMVQVGTAERENIARDAFAKSVMVLAIKLKMAKSAKE